MLFRIRPEQKNGGHTLLQMRSVFLCVLFSLWVPLVTVFAESRISEIPAFIHLPIIESCEESPTGIKTTWSCVYFGAYPASEVVDSEWDAVDACGLAEGDLIRDDSLYARLAEANWQDNVAELDGVSYYRVGLDMAPAEAGIREQHYTWESTRPWHYFRIDPVRWRVLDIRDGKALLLVDRMPDCVPFHETDEEVTWEDSTLRSWLNGYDGTANRKGTDYTGIGFIDRAFTDEQRKAILVTLCHNEPNQDYGTDSGADTEDYLFLLSNAEVFEGSMAERYGFQPSRDYDDPAKRFSSTLYAKCMGAWWSPFDEYEGNSFWFMRTNGYIPRSVTYVCDFGYIYSKGTLVTCSDAAVLPAMWVDLSHASLLEAGETVSVDIIRTADDEKPAYDIPELWNPVIVEDSHMPGGVYTVWNAVMFGHYPQTEIVEKAGERGDSETEREINPGLFRALSEAEENGQADVMLEGMRYIRLDNRWFRCDPIIWRVLEVSDGMTLLMADRCLDSVPYHSQYRDVFWEESDIRKWLNGLEMNRGAVSSQYGEKNFIEMAFTDEEREAIAVSLINNANNYYFGTACGSGTHDRVFLLSEEEVFYSEKALRYGFSPQ